MIGLMSRTTSPSSVLSRRSTPCVAGWCGPMLSVSSSSCSGCSMWESSCDSSISRYGMLRRAARGVDVAHSHHPGIVALVVREQDRLAADREVAALRVALVVLGHEDAPQVGVAVEDHAEHVVDLALLVVRRSATRRHRGHRRARRSARACARRCGRPSPCRAARSGRRGAAPRGSSRRRARRRGSRSPCRAGLERRRHRLPAATSTRGAVAEEHRVEHAVVVPVAQLLRDQLEAGRVRHSCPSCRRRGR